MKEQTKAAPGARPALCPKCRLQGGCIPVVRVDITLASREGDGGRTERQTFHLPCDAQRTLEWFQYLRGSPASWGIYLLMVPCDCRRGALDQAILKANADPRRTGPERQREQTYTEIVTWEPPDGPDQDAEGLRLDLAVMLSETWPGAETALPPARVATSRAIRERHRGRLEYDVPAWARMKGGQWHAEVERGPARDGRALASGEGLEK